MSAQMQSTPETLPAFCEGIQYFADTLSGNRPPGRSAAAGAGLPGAAGRDR